MNQYHAEGYPEIYYLSNLGRGRQAERQAPRSRHGALAHGRLVGAPHRAGDPALRGRGAGRGRRRRASPACTTRTRRWTTGTRRRPGPAARGAQPRLLAHAAPRRGPDDRGAAEGAAARWPTRSCGSIPRPGADVRLSRRPRLVRRGHAARAGAAADRGAERVQGRSTRRRVLRAPVAPGRHWSSGTTAACCTRRNLTTSPLKRG